MSVEMIKAIKNIEEPEYLHFKESTGDCIKISCPACEKEFVFCQSKISKGKYGVSCPCCGFVCKAEKV